MNLMETYLRNGLKKALIGIVDMTDPNTALIRIQHISASPKSYSFMKVPRKQLARYCTFLANAKKDALEEIDKRFPRFSRGRRGIAGSILYDEFTSAISSERLTAESLAEMQRQLFNTSYAPEPLPIVHPNVARRLVEIEDERILRHLEELRRPLMPFSIDFANGSRIEVPQRMGMAVRGQNIASAYMAGAGGTL